MIQAKNNDEFEKRRKMHIELHHFVQTVQKEPPMVFSHYTIGGAFFLLSVFTGPVQLFCVFCFLMYYFVCFEIEMAHVFEKIYDIIKIKVYICLADIC